MEQHLLNARRVPVTSARQQCQCRKGSKVDHREAIAGPNVSLVDTSWRSNLFSVDIDPQ